MRLADATTLAAAGLATTSPALGVGCGRVELAARLLLVVYALDALNGIIARREGPSSEGHLLD